MKIPSLEALKIWGGVECSLNRVENNYMDQLNLVGHYDRNDDIERIASIGMKALRYPVLWEKYAPDQDAEIDWSFPAQQLKKLKSAGVEPIVGLVHHGSGPRYVNFYDESFAAGLAAYAFNVAKEFPWAEMYTPVNEPLTTARFCGLYGHWYPHGCSDYSFLKILLSKCKAIVMAMAEIRKVNPHAKLVQTEDLGKSHSTPLLQYQADFENERRWLSFDLLCGKMKPGHIMWNYFLDSGIATEELQFFLDNPCPPDIMGINHYITSERWLDERIDRYPAHTWGGNKQFKYADVEAVRSSKECMAGPEQLLMETWERFKLPIAVTEVHLHCTREEQLRWFYHVWNAANTAKEKGADMRAVTAWAVLGSFDWCSLLTRPNGIYEPGLFDVRSKNIRATALNKMVSTLARGQRFYHPLLDENGWWNRACRVIYFEDNNKPEQGEVMKIPHTRPLLIIGKTGTLGKAFSRICTERAIYQISLGRQDINIMDESDIERTIKQYKPWAVVNAAGFVRVDDAEEKCEDCFAVNSLAPQYMADVCDKLGIQFLTFSSDLVFNGKKNAPYLESDLVSPLNIYGKSKALAEEKVMEYNPSALIIRTSAFFGPWDQYNFVHAVLHSLKENHAMSMASDITISPTYVPDLVHTTLDLLIDEEKGIWNICNNGEVTWYTLAEEVAKRSGLKTSIFKGVPHAELGWKASRPAYSVMSTERGFSLPSLDDALDRYFAAQETIQL